MPDKKKFILPDYDSIGSDSQTNENGIIISKPFIRSQGIDTKQIGSLLNKPTFAENTRPGAERYGGVENKLANILFAPAEAMIGGVQSGVENLSEAGKRFISDTSLNEEQGKEIGLKQRESDPLGASLGVLTGASHLALGAAQAIPAMAGFTSGATAVGEFGGDVVKKALPYALSPFQTIQKELTEQTSLSPEEQEKIGLKWDAKPSYQMQKTTELGDVILPLLMVGGYRAGRGKVRELLNKSEKVTESQSERIIDEEIKPEIKEEIIPEKTPDKVINEELIKSETPEELPSAKPEAKVEPIESGKPGKDIPLKEEAETIGITKAKLKEVREKVGLPEIEQELTKHNPETFARVKEANADPVRLAKNILERPPSELPDEQAAALIYGLAKENNRYDELFVKLKEVQTSGDANAELDLRGQMNDVVSNMETISRGAKSLGTNSFGRLGQIMQRQLNSDYSLARVIQRATMKAPDGKVPETSKNLFEKTVPKLEEVEKLISTYTIEKGKTAAREFIQKLVKDNDLDMRRIGRKYVKQDLKAEREVLWNDFYKATNVAAAGLPLTPEAITAMRKLALNYVKDGITTLDGIVDEFYNVLKDKFPNVEKSEIVNAFSAQLKTEPKSKNEITALYQSLRKEAREISKKESLLEKDIKKYNDNPQWFKERSKLKAQKTKVQNEIQKYKKMIDENKFERPKKGEPVTPDEGLLDLQTERRKFKMVIDAELEKIDRANMTRGQRYWENFTKLLNVQRTLLVGGGDQSMPFRQSLPATVTFPKLAYKNFIDMHKAGVSDQFFQRLAANIENRPNANLYTKFKLDFTGTSKDITDLAKREESLLSADIVNKVPLIKHLNKYSERGAVAYTNAMKADVFDYGVDLMRKSGLTPERNPKAFADFAKVVNWSNGRAYLGRIGEVAAPVLSGLLFSPRNFVAKLEMMNPYRYLTLEPHARNLLAREMVSTLAFGVTVLNLAKLGGAEVALETTSPDFGKIKIGNTRIDLWGGYQQIFVLLAKMIRGGQLNKSGKFQKFDRPNRRVTDPTRASVLGRFARSKLSPTAALGYDWGAQQNFDGTPFGKDVGAELYNRMLPMLYQDTWDAVKELGIAGGLGVGLGSYVGIGSQTWQAKKKKVNPYK